MTETVYDDFMPDPDAIRAHALASEFVDWKGPDGETYKRVWLGEVPGLLERIEAAMGEPVHMLGMGYRLNFGGELPNAAVHSDIGWGTHALVLYLSENCNGKSGTAFWSHRRSGLGRFDERLAGDLPALEKEWNDESAWSMNSFVPMRYNRALIYESALFHSRYPFAAFGYNAESGRLIAVAFFTPRSWQ